MPIPEPGLDLVLVTRVRRIGSRIETEIGLLDGAHAQALKARYDAQVKDKRRQSRRDTIDAFSKAILGGKPAEGDAEGWVVTLVPLNGFTALPTLDTSHWYGDWK